jgi:anti-sigma regulatory factor (Ser/Thr protein kinase)
VTSTGAAMTTSRAATSSTIDVRFAALPAHVRTARLIAAAVARRAGVDESLLDEVRLAVGEACSRAVGLHEQHAPYEVVALALSCDGGRFVVEVADVAPPDAQRVPADLDPEWLTVTEPAVGVPDAQNAEDALAPGPIGTGRPEPFPELLPAGFGLAVITGLVDDVHITHGALGSRVRMSWPAAGEPGPPRPA